jgi:hypothetical protein
VFSERRAFVAPHRPRRRWSRRPSSIRRTLAHGAESRIGPRAFARNAGSQGHMEQSASVGASSDMWASYIRCRRCWPGVGSFVAKPLVGQEGSCACRPSTYSNGSPPAAHRAARFRMMSMRQPLVEHVTDDKHRERKSEKASAIT